MRRASVAHGEHEKRRGGEYDVNWPDSGVRSIETQRLIKDAMERGFQTRDAEMELAEMLGDLGDTA